MSLKLLYVAQLLIFLYISVSFYVFYLLLSMLSYSFKKKIFLTLDFVPNFPWKFLNYLHLWWFYSPFHHQFLLFHIFWFIVTRSTNLQLTSLHCQILLIWVRKIVWGPHNLESSQKWCSVSPGSLSPSSLSPPENEILENRQKTSQSMWCCYERSVTTQLYTMEM